MNQFNNSVYQLQKLYDTAGPFYLSEFFHSNGNKKLYDFLTSVYQTEYSNNFRILIVQDCADVYDYQDLPGQALCALQKYANQIDISNFFIVIVTGNKNIDTELDSVQKLYSTDSCKMQSHLVDNIEYTVTYQKQDTFCALPWMHLYVGPDGNVLPCCVADQQFPMGSINNTSVDDILKSSEFTRLRANMLSGKRSKECKRCYDQEDAGVKSTRQNHNARWSRKTLTVNADGSIDKFHPKYLDIRLNNICNLKCRMCSGYFSSAIAQEEAKLFGNRVYLDSVMQSAQKTLALDEIIKYLPHAEKIYFAGGEPLLSPEHYTILNALIECNNTSLEVTYNTNFTLLTYKDILVLDLWKKFTNLTVGASLDATGSVAEYVRHGTDWSLVESNLASLKLHCPHVNFTVSSVVGLLNVSSLIDLQKTWHTNGILDISKFSLSTMIGPEHLTVCVLPRAHKARLTTEIIDHIDWCYQRQASNLAGQWSAVLTYMNNKDLSYLLPEFRRLTLTMDQYRKESFADIFTEYRDLI
jgi:radical SAM protein with 4Fe4S-binding SPASM domain